MTKTKIDLPDRLRVAIGPPRFHGPVAGPGDLYLADCWAAVLGPTPVLCYLRLHQLLGEQVATVALASSLGLHLQDWLLQLGHCIARLEQYNALAVRGGTVSLAPGLRQLTPDEVRSAGPIIEALHSAHLQRARREPIGAVGCGSPDS